MAPSLYALLYCSSNFAIDVEPYHEVLHRHVALRGGYDLALTRARQPLSLSRVEADHHRGSLTCNGEVVHLK